MEMSSDDSSGVTLALVDPSLLSSWEGMVKRGVECSLLLKHSKGKIIATLQSTTPSPCPSLSSSKTSPSSAEKRKKRKKRKGSKEKRLKDLLAYHQRLVVEKGLPPSRLMEQHAAASAIAPASSNQRPGCKEKLVKCDQCDFSSVSQRGLKVHVGRNHKVQQAAEILREDREDLEVSLNLSQQSDERDENISSVNEEVIEEVIVLNEAMKGQKDEEISSFISALRKVFNLWPQDDPPHRCPPWDRCRNLKCMVEAEIENQEYAAAGECDDCGENINDCECGS